MMNQSGVVRTVGAAPTQILLNTDLQYSLGIVVDSTEVEADSNGRKIIKAGTPLSGNLDARTTAFKKAKTTSDASDAVGILLHDVDVTSGKGNGTLLIFGFVNINRIDNTTKTLIDTAVKKKLDGKVTFIAG